jgi:hypothetical protein
MNWFFKKEGRLDRMFDRCRGGLDDYGKNYMLYGA